jgi:tetratricopeptide (TPR) repeat protein
VTDNNHLANWVSSADENALIEKAMALHQAGDFEGACSLYERVLQINPNSFDTMNFLGLIAYERADYSGSLQWFKQAIALYPSNPHFYINTGRTLRRMSRLQDAKAVLTEVIKLDENFIEAYCECASVMCELGESEQALALLDAADEKMSDELVHDSRAWTEQFIQVALRRGEALRQTGRLQESLACLERAKALCLNPSATHSNLPSSPSSQLAQLELYLGLAHEDLGQLGGAREAYNRACSLSPRNWRAIFNRGNVSQKLGLWLEAQTDYEEVLSLNAQCAAAALNLGLLFYKQANYELAQLYLSKAIEIDPHNSLAYSNLGVVLFETAKYLQALDAFNLSTQYDPLHVEAFSNKGNVLKELRMFDAALHAYNQAIALNDSFEEAYSNRGVVYFELGELELALKDYDRAIELNPHLASAHSNRANVFKERGQLELALKSLSVAIELQFELCQKGQLPRRMKPPQPMSVQQASKVLMNLHQLLSRHGIEFFLAYGTLLGIYRDSEILAHDKDLDVGLHWSCSRSQLIQVLLACGQYWIDPKALAQPKMSEEDMLNPCALNIGVIEKSTGISIDFFFFKPEGDVVLSGFYHLPDPLLWRFTPFELQGIEYKGLTFNTPGDPEVYLRDIYGENWRVPDPYFDSLVSGFNLDARSRGVSKVYAYSRLFDQLIEQNWKKAYGYCLQLQNYGEDELITQVKNYLARVLELA